MVYPFTLFEIMKMMVQNGSNGPCFCGSSRVLMIFSMFCWRPWSLEAAMEGAFTRHIVSPERMLAAPAPRRLRGEMLKCP